MYLQKSMHLIRPRPRWCLFPAAGNLYGQAPPLLLPVRAASTFYVNNPPLLQPVRAASAFYVKDYMEKAKFFGTSLVMLQLCGTSFVMCVVGGDDAKDGQSITKKSAKRGAEYIEKFRLGPGSEWVDLDSMIQDPENRDNEGVKIIEVLTKAEGIEHQGFNFEKVRVILVQLPLDPQKRSKVFNKNRDWKAQDPLYPSWDEKKVECTVVGGNHLVTFLKMVRLSTHTDSFTSVKLADGVSSRTSLHLLCILWDPFFELLPLG